MPYYADRKDRPESSGSCQHGYIRDFPASIYRFLFDYNTIFPKEISIDEAIRKGLSDCLMHRRIIDTVTAPWFKGNLEIFLQLVIDAEIEIAKISGPFARTGLKSVCPADGRIQDLSVIQEVFRKLTDDIEFVPEHKKACAGRMQATIFF